MTRSQRLAAWYTRTVCFLFRGHRFTRTHEAGRLMLVCTCGKTTPGWVTSDLKPPRPRFAGDPNRHRL